MTFRGLYQGNPRDLRDFQDIIDIVERSSTDEGAA